MDCNHSSLYKHTDIEDQWLESKLLCSGLYYLWNISESFFFTFNENSGVTFLIIICILILLIKCQLVIIDRFMFDDFEFLINKHKLFEFMASFFLFISFYGSILVFEQTWNITFGMNANRVIFKDNSILIYGLTFGTGMIFLLQKKEMLKIPIYSTLVSFVGIFLYLCMIGIVYIIGELTVYILICSLAFYILLIFAIMKLTDSDKNAMEAMRKELDNDMYEFSYKYPEDKKKGFSEDDKDNSLYSEEDDEDDSNFDSNSGTNSEKKSIKVKSNFEEDEEDEDEDEDNDNDDDEEKDSNADSEDAPKEKPVNLASEDSYVDEYSDESNEEELIQYKKNLILLLELEMKPKDTIFQLIKKPFQDLEEEKNSGLISDFLEMFLIWLFIISIPCLKNYFKKEYYEIGLYFLSFIFFFYILINIPLVFIIMLSFIMTCFFFILRYFLKENEKTIFEACMSLAFCWCYLIKINFFFFDILTFFKFWSNLYVVEVMELAGLPILFPIIVFNFILIQKGRTLLAFSNIMMVILFYLFGFFFLEGLSSLIVGKNSFSVVDSAIFEADIDKIYLDFNFQVFIIIFTILLYAVYFWLRKFSTDKTFGYCLIGIGGFYFFVQNLFTYIHVDSLNIYD